MKIAIGIPCINNLQGLKTLVKQIHQQVSIESEVFMVANSFHVEDIAADLFRQRLISHYFVPQTHNLGVAGSWNWLAQRAFDIEGYQRIVLINDDVTFTAPDALGQLMATSLLNPDMLLLTVGGFSCFVLPKVVWDRVGEFDEEFFPAYFEDQDYVYRCKLKKMDIQRLYDLDSIQHFGQTSTLIDPELGKDREKCRLRYQKKYGGDPGEEKFVLPFNFPLLSLPSKKL